MFGTLESLAQLSQIRDDYFGKSALNLRVGEPVMADESCTSLFLEFAIGGLLCAQKLLSCWKADFPATGMITSTSSVWLIAAGASSKANAIAARP